MSYNKWNPPPQGLFLPSVSGNFTKAFCNRLVACTPSFAYNLGLPPGDNLASKNENEIYTYDIDFTSTPFTYLNASNVTTDPCPTIIFNLYNVPFGAMFIINGPASYKSGSTGQLILHKDGGTTSRLEIIDQTSSAVKNQLVIRNSTGLVAKALY